MSESMKLLQEQMIIEVKALLVTKDTCLAKDIVDAYLQFGFQRFASCIKELSRLESNYRNERMAQDQMALDDIKKTNAEMEAVG